VQNRPLKSISLLKTPSVLLKSLLCYFPISIYRFET
jgi:hypothetical protein